MGSRSSSIRQQCKASATRVADRAMSYRFVQQFVALLYKNVLVAWRSRRSTALRLFAPFLFLLMALIVNLALNANNALQERFTAVRTATGVPISPIPSCGDDLYIAGRPCIDFVWTPSNDTAAQAIVDAIRLSNNPPIPAHKVLGFTTRTAADEYMMTHPDGCLGALHLVRQQSLGDNATAFSYLVTSNSTVKYFKGAFQDPVNFFQMPLINAVSRELSRTYVKAAAANTAAAAAGGGLVEDSRSSSIPPLALAASLVNGSSSSTAFDWAPRMVRFPHPSLQTVNLLGQVLSSFIFASLMFGCVSQISGLVSERCAGLRLSLTNMGMSQGAYWVSWMAFDVVLTFATALLLVLFGMVLQFDFFLHNDFSLLLMLFWLFSLALTSFSYMLSVLAKSPQSAMYMGFSVFLVGWMFQTVQFLVKLPYTPATYFSTSNKWGRIFFWSFSTYPWNPLTKGILDLNEATLAPSDPGLRWSQLYSYCSYQPDPKQQAPYDPRVEFRSYDCIYPLWQVYVTLVIQWAWYWLLAVYLSNVLPNEVGARRPWSYLLRRSYWRPAAYTAADVREELQQLLADEAAGVCRPPPLSECNPGGVEECIDADVDGEERKMRRLLEDRALQGVVPATPPAATAASSKDPYSSLSANNMGGAAVGQQQPSTSSNTQYAAELFGLRKVFRAGRSLPHLLSSCTRPSAFTQGGCGGCCCCFGAHGGSSGDDSEQQLAAVVTAGAASSSSGYVGSTYNVVRDSSSGGGSSSASRSSSCGWLHCCGCGGNSSGQQRGSGGGGSSSSSKKTRRKKEDFWAIRGTWLGIERGQLFCLLGPNGAGKTTTINCLTGVLPFSGGDALIYGRSIKSEAGLDSVRPLMGVCPQFDVLWGELSGREHLVIAGHIKGLPWNKVSSEASSLLSRVHLSGASGLRSASYSGGMKRRLSVALALLGDPRIVYLDEPTTGMDPISRRHVWDIITAAKPGRAIVLTTHSMEEADVLGDRIAIMARGRIRALGSSLRLKQKYGSGYQLTVHVGLPEGNSSNPLSALSIPPAAAAAVAGGSKSSASSSNLLSPQQQEDLVARIEAVKAEFRTWLGVEPVGAASSRPQPLLQYLVGPDVPQQQLVAFLQHLEGLAGAALGVLDIQASLASLEEVFLNIAKQAELEAAAASGSSLVSVDLPDGTGSIMVPLGEEEVVVTTTNSSSSNGGAGGGVVGVVGEGVSTRTYSIKWAQDDAGRLVVLSCTLKQEDSCDVLQLQQQQAVQYGQQQQRADYLQPQQQEMLAGQLGLGSPRREQQIGIGSRRHHQQHQHQHQQQQRRAHQLTTQQACELVTHQPPPQGDLPLWQLLQEQSNSA